MTSLSKTINTDHDAVNSSSSITLTMMHFIKTPKSLFIRFIALYFCVLMHYFQHNYGGSGLDVPINPLGWIVVSCLVGLGLVQMIKTRTFVYNRYLMVVAACCCLLLIPLLYSDIQAVHSYSRLLGLFAGLLVLAAFYQMKFNQADRRLILWLMLIGVFLESLFALAQFYVFPLIPALGMNIARPSAIFFQANVAATFFATGLMISLYLSHLLHANAGKIVRCILWIAPLTITIAIILLQSRTGFLGCIVSIIIWLTINRSIPKKWLISVMSGIGIAILSLYLLSGAIRDAKIYTQDSARTQIYSDAFNAIKRAPVLGHGYGSFGYTFREQQALAFKSDDKHPQIYNLSHPHNELLLWGVEGGIVALLPLFIILFYSAKLFYRNRQTLALLAIVFPISLHLFTEFPFYHSVASYLTFLLLLGLISDTKIRSKSVDFNYPQLTGTLVLISIFLNSLVMFNLLSGQNTLTQAVREQKLDNVLESQYFFMSDDFELILNESLLSLAITHNIPVGATAYNKWIKSRIESYPRERNFRQLYASYLFLNEALLADQTLARARFLFPTLQWAAKTPAKLINNAKSNTATSYKVKLNQENSN
jgi:O-antigen polymerase